MNDDFGRQNLATGTIVVGVDAHDTWQDAVDWATDQAALEGRAVTLVHVAEAAEQIWHDPDGRERRIGVPPGPGVAGLLLEQARARATTRQPDVAVRATLCSGGVRDSLHIAARDAHLLVIGARQHRTLWSVLFGTVGSAVAKRPPCPTVVVHNVHPGTEGRGVLAGIDDTEHSRAVLRFAFQQASWRHLPLSIVHVALAPTYGEPTDESEQHLEMAEAIAGLGEEYPDVTVRTTIARGEPSYALLRASRAMHLAVLGAHHRHPTSELRFGSVVAPVVERATCPVAVVPDLTRVGQTS